MKLFIVAFLGLFVCGMQAELSFVAKEESDFQSSLFDYVRQSSENFTNAILVPFKTSSNQLNATLDRTLSKIDATCARSLKKANSTVVALQEEIVALKEKNPKSSECLKKYEEQVLSTKQIFEDNIGKCSYNLKQNLENNQLSSEDYLVEIDEYIEEFRLESVTCVTFDPVKTTECVFTKIHQYTNLINDIGELYNAAVRETSKQSVFAQRAIRECTSGILQKTSESLKHLEHSLASCEHENEE